MENSAPTTKKRVLYCPLLSAGNQDYQVCLQENCAWWQLSTKTCIANVIAHNTILDIKAKQGK